MKKIFLFVLGILFSGVALAAVVTITAKQTGDEVVSSEFNQILGIVAQLRNTTGTLGIGVEPATGVTLDVGGIIRTAPRNVDLVSPCTGQNGVFAYDQTDQHLYGCTNGVWVQLDNEDAVILVNGDCNNSTVNDCNAGTYSHVTDTATDYKWDCVGTGGGTTDNCSKVKACVLNDCAASTCSTTTCNNGCAVVDGTKDCSSCTPTNICATTTCVGDTCNNGCAIVDGTKTDGVCAGPPPCEAVTISNCDLSETASGGTDGSCESGYTEGSCSYGCNNGSWTESNNTCARDYL